MGVESVTSEPRQHALFFFFSSRRRHTRCLSDWSSDGALPIYLPDRVEIPRWRYAIINFPHPLLASGLTVLDTPGHAALSAEPELTLHRIPDAAAVVFMVAADTGMTAADEALWKEHIAPIEGLQETCFIALNKIDALRDGSKSESKVLEEIDSQVRATADALGVAP